MTAKNRRIKRLREQLARANSDIRVLIEGGSPAEALAAKYRLKLAFEKNAQERMWFGRATSGAPAISSGLARLLSGGTPLHVDTDKRCIMCNLNERSALNHMCSDCWQKWTQPRQAK